MRIPSARFAYNVASFSNSSRTRNCAWIGADLAAKYRAVNDATALASFLANYKRIRRTAVPSLTGCACANRGNYVDARPKRDGREKDDAGTFHARRDGRAPPGSGSPALDGIIFIILRRRIATVDNYTPVKIGNYELACANGGERALHVAC